MASAPSSRSSENSGSLLLIALVLRDQISERENCPFSDAPGLFEVPALSRACGARCSFVVREHVFDICGEAVRQTGDADTTVGRTCKCVDLDPRDRAPVLFRIQSAQRTISGRRDQSVHDVHETVPLGQADQFVNSGDGIEPVA